MRRAYEQSVADARAEEEALRTVLPTKGFLGAYLKYTDRQESPGSFHFWVGATILGAVLQRRCWVSKGIYQVYPNFFTVLVAPSGRCRKSRAAALGIDLLAPFEWANVCADKTTPEALIQALAFGTASMEEGASAPRQDGNSTGIIPASELSVFINRQQYTSGMVTLMTHLYDCPQTFKYLTRNRRPLVLRNVSLSMVGCTTPDWLATNLPESAFEGGFMSRMVFVVKFQRDRMIAIPEAIPQDEMEELKIQLLQIRAEMLGEVRMSKDGEDWFRKWYEGLAMAPVDDIMLLGFVERKPDTVLKLALILAASELRHSIELHDLEQAHQIVTWTQERMFHAFKNVDMSVIGAIANKICDLLDANGGALSRRDVLRKFGNRLPHGLTDLQTIENLLIETGYVNVELLPVEGRGGRPTVIYRRNYDKEGPIRVDYEGTTD